MDVEAPLEIQYWASRRRQIKITDYLRLIKIMNAYRVLLHVLYSCMQIYNYSRLIFVLPNFNYNLNLK
jgi:hypothetical protein